MRREALNGRVAVTVYVLGRRSGVSLQGVLGIEGWCVRAMTPGRTWDDGGSGSG
jgi:hypothetical protein